MRLARDRLSLERAHEHFERLRPFLPPNARCLEIGSGFGSLVAYALRWGNVSAWGIEPDHDAVAIGGDVLAELGLPPAQLARSVGEALPFASHSMDLVCSFNVFEHVANPQAVLAEAIRVLKPGGYLYFSFPSYGSWWEGHYGVLWLPGMPKWLAKIYVRLLGRRADFIDHLQFITYRRLMQLLATLGDQVEVCDTGQGLWEERLRSLAFSDWAQLGRLKGWIRLLHRLHLVELLILLGQRFHWETPFVVVLRKR